MSGVLKSVRSRLTRRWEGRGSPAAARALAGGYRGLLETREWLYIFSPWSNGTRVMGGATAGTVTCKQMRVLAKTDPSGA